MIMRFTQMAFALLCLLSPLVVNAHTNEVNQAELQLLKDNKYQLTVSIDALHLIKNQQAFSGDEPQLIYYLKGLSLIETKQLLSTITQKLTDQTTFLINEESVPVAHFQD